MYRVLVVDDEYWALQGVIRSFPWEKYGFEVVASATNSKQAYEYIKELEPDVVFSDVCMPEMSGLELCSLCREEGYPALFIFVSGYDDYKYTREAIRNGAFDYCLKPLDEEETERVLVRLKDYFDSQIDQNEQDEREIGISEEADDDNGEIYNREFKRMIDYINNNYTKPLLLKNLAKQFFINESYCCFLFNKHVGMSFSKYLNKMRIEKAMEIIRANRTLTIDEVSELTGYASYYHFNKKFKEVTGISPAQIRKGVRISQSEEE